MWPASSIVLTWSRLTGNAVAAVLAPPLTIALALVGSIRKKLTVAPVQTWVCWIVTDTVFTVVSTIPQAARACVALDLMWPAGTTIQTRLLVALDAYIAGVTCPRSATGAEPGTFIDATGPTMQTRLPVTHAV